jgi:predicted dehydrogenase
LATSAAASADIGRCAHAAGSDRLRIGLIGCGGRGRGAAVNALQANPAATLTALADAFPDYVKNAGQMLKVDQEHCFSGFDGYRKLLASGVDIAILAEPPHFRPIHAEACIEAGVHVFAEKPMAVDAPGVRRLLAAGQKARQKKLSFVSGFETRYKETAREAIKRVHDGAIGQIVMIHGNFNTGPLWHRGRQPDWTEMEFQLRNWYYFTWLSGDHNVEQHVHCMDLASWIMREEPPVCAWGLGGRQVRVEPQYGDIFDHHAVVYEYASGARVYGFCRQQAGTWGDWSVVAVGTKGRLAAPGQSNFTIEGPMSWKSGPDRVDPEITTFREMYQGIWQANPINDSLALARSTMLSILGRMVTHSGHRITWDEALASNRVLAPNRYAWDADPPVLPGPDGKYPVAVPGVTNVL